MKILELFSGNGDISKAFKLRGHEVYRIDWSEKVEAELHVDVSNLSPSDIIKLCDGVPDVIWASPDCTTYSIATHRHIDWGSEVKRDYLSLGEMPVELCNHIALISEV